MPAFRENDPRHPTNRCHLIYAAAVRAAGPGARITTDQWRSMVKVATGVIVGRQVEDYTQTMEDLLMVKRHGREGVEVLADGLRLLTDALESLGTGEPIAEAPAPLVHMVSLPTSPRP